jgi:hypothetical protein
MDRRAKIFAARDLKTETLTIPEWDVDLEVRGISAAARQGLYDNSKNDDGSVDENKVTLGLIVAAVHDPETGKPLFTVADRDALAEKSADIIDRIAAVALRLSGMGQAATKAIEGN